MSDMHEIGASILRSLSLTLHLPINRSLESSHRPLIPSTSGLGVLRYPRRLAESPPLAHNAHTDIGSLTLLFCPEPGLQILDPTTDDQWAFVEPKKDHAIVNVGDSLRLLSRQRLRSCLHRVVLPMEEEGKMADRCLLAYFLRPELEAMFVDEGGKARRSIEWHEEKFKRFRASVEKQQRDSVSTGEAGLLGS